MKINIILPMLAKSGGSAVIYRYVEILRNQGHDIIVYKPIISFNMRRYPSRIKNYIHKLYCTCKGIPRIFSRNNIVDRFIPIVSDMFIRDADIVIATSWPTTFSVNKLKNKKGKKIYFIQDFEIWDNEEFGLKSYLLPLNKIVISSWINQQLKDKLNLGPYPIVFNGLDKDSFKNLNKIYNNHGKPIRCLMLNHVSEKKGINDGIRAFEIARNIYPNIVLESFGLCSNRNLPYHVKYTQNPTRQELVELYCNSDIFIFPSHTEGWGLTPLEAMACKCAVVGTNTGFVHDLGKNGINMLISECGDINDISQNIVKLAKNPKLREKISEEGFATASQLDWYSSAMVLENLLISISNA